MGSLDKLRKRYNGIRHIIGVLQDDEDLKNKGVMIPPDGASSIKSGLLILSVAYFESFVKDTVTEFIDSLNEVDPKLPWRKLPDRLRKAHLFDNVRYVLRFPRSENVDYCEKECISTLEDVVSVRRQNYRLSDMGLTDLKGNPNSKNVREALKRINISKLYERIQPDMYAKDNRYNEGKDIIEKLDSILEVRHALAHGSDGSNYSWSDILEYLQFLEWLAEAISRLVINQIFGLMQLQPPT